MCFNLTGGRSFGAGHVGDLDVGGWWSVVGESVEDLSVLTCQRTARLLFSKSLLMDFMKK